MPTCRSGQKSVYGASVGETVAISCDVDASPAHVTFTWAHRPAGRDVNETAELNFAGDGTRSWLYFTAGSRGDFGSFTCAGRNSLGKQLEPCVFQLTAAGEHKVIRLMHAH